MIIKLEFGDKLEENDEELDRLVRFKWYDDKKRINEDKK